MWLLPWNEKEVHLSIAFDTVQKLHQQLFKRLRHLQAFLIIKLLLLLTMVETFFIQEKHKTSDVLRIDSELESDGTEKPCNHVLYKLIMFN